MSRLFNVFNKIMLINLHIYDIPDIDELIKSLQGFPYKLDCMACCFALNHW